MKKKHTHTQMNVYDPAAQKRATLAEILKKVREKGQWLRHSDRVKLAKNHGVTLATVSRQLNGKTKKINPKLVADALDYANGYEAMITSRL